MLVRVEKLQGLGLFHDPRDIAKHKLRKATLLFAENGRGKSTLAAMLRSVASGNAQVLAERATIDGTLPARVVLQLDNGHKVTFSGGQWSEARPEFVVFDADFVEKNVYSGSAPGPGQRRNLLEFALGPHAVTARRAEEVATETARRLSDRIRELQMTLSGHHRGMSLAEFETLALLAPGEDADAEVRLLEKRISEATAAQVIGRRALPDTVRVPAFDIGALFALLRESLKKVEDDAEALVRRHLQGLAGGAASSWIHQGLGLARGETCPWCAQDTSASDLIAAYRHYFDARYADLKARVAKVTRGIDVRAGEAVATSLAEKFRLAETTISAWGEQVQTITPRFERDRASELLGQLRAVLQPLGLRKEASPDEAIGTLAEEAMANDLWRAFLELVGQANAQIEAATAAIRGYRDGLAVENVQQLHGMVRTWAHRVRRSDADVVSLFEALECTRRDLAEAEGAKNAARSNLNDVMATTLANYQAQMNEILSGFGAPFRIEGMSANYRGQGPRTEYALEFRGKSISLDGSPPSFATVLSDGDKRTLAFAFFMASALAAPSIGSLVFVVDDPMCSLDINRRHNSIRLLGRLGKEAQQIIVLAHDAFFVRDLRDGLVGLGIDTETLRLRSGANDYSDIEACDLDKECESPFRRHHRAVKEFATTGAGDPFAVAKSIRPMLEAHLHRRFPELLPRGTFGNQIEFIRAAPATSPVANAKGLVAKLQDVNDYVWRFHHDSNPDCEEAVPVATELATCCRKALEIVYC